MIRFIIGLIAGIGTTIGLTIYFDMGFFGFIVSAVIGIFVLGLIAVPDVAGQAIDNMDDMMARANPDPYKRATYNKLKDISKKK